MRLVDSARQFPGTCAVLPHIGGNHPSGYIDSGVTTPDGHRTYISVLAFAQMAEALGYRRGPAPDARRIALLEQRIAELEAQVAERDEQLAAVGTLRLAGAAPARKPRAKAAA